MNKRTFSIQAQYLNRLAKDVEALSKRSIRLGMDAVTYEVEREYFAEVKRFNEYFQEYETVTIEMVEVTVTNPSVKIEGYDLVGSVDYDPTVVKTRPGFEGDLSRFRDSGAICEHCNKTRSRKTTYLLQDTEGKLTQVGSTCVHDFLGIDVKEFYQAVRCWDHDYDYTGEPALVAYEAIQLLNVTQLVIEECGWVSGTKAREWGKASTAMSVKWFQDETRKGNKRELKDYFGEDYEAKLETYTAKSARVIEWVASVEDDSDYMLNLKAILAERFVKFANVNFAVSAVAAYDRYLERKASKSDFAKLCETSKYVGAIGDKFGRKLSKVDRTKGKASHPAIEAALMSKRSFDNDWGTSHLIKFVTDEGIVFEWWASTSLPEIEAGQRVSIKATLKKRSEFKGLKSNVLTRCDVTAL